MLHSNGKKKKIGKTPGHDNVTTEMVKFMSRERKQELHDIINQANREKNVPLDWLISIISHIHKKGGTVNSANFRGITVGSVVAKIYARILEQLKTIHLKKAKTASENKKEPMITYLFLNK